MIKGHISVIMGVYNCGEIVRESIDSILAQTYTNWKMIICNDCSTDNTVEILNEYAEKYPEKFLIIHNKNNSRLAASLNYCLKYADGEFIARMDDDDISAPDRFEKQIAFLKENPDIDLVGTYMQRFDGDVYVDVVKTPLKPGKYTLKNAVPFNHATIMTYKRVYDKLGGYTVSPLTVRAEDLDLWFRFFAEGFSGENISEPLYFVRENIAAIKRRTLKSRWNAFKIRRYGYKLFNYPRHWIVKPFFITLIKSITPDFITSIYRWIQSKINK